MFEGLSLTHLCLAIKTSITRSFQKQFSVRCLPTCSKRSSLWYFLLSHHEHCYTRKPAFESRSWCGYGIFPCLYLSAYGWLPCPFSLLKTHANLNFCIPKVVRWLKSEGKLISQFALFNNRFCTYSGKLTESRPFSYTYNTFAALLIDLIVKIGSLMMLKLDAGQ